MMHGSMCMAACAWQHVHGSMCMTAWRRAQALPAVHDANEMHHLERTLKAATSYHLPVTWLRALQIKDHWDQEKVVVTDAA